MKNIEAFNIAVGCIFGQCYKEFPLKTNISTWEVGEAIKNSCGTENRDHTNLDDYEYKVVESTMKWLVQSGYLWCDNTKKPINFEGVVVTPRGLEVLNLMPDSLGHRQTIGETLSKGAKEVGREVTMTSVQLCLGLGAKLLAGT